MDTSVHIELLEKESHTFGGMIADADMGAPVPSCPGWTAADLVTHLIGVQRFWGTIAESLLDDPTGVEEDEDRSAATDPVDAALLSIGFQSASHRLISALRSHDPADECWTWAREAGTIAWVARRQHHEAAVHRADLDLASGRTPALDDATALDGIDELIDVMLDGFPDWGRFEPGTIVEIAPDGAVSRHVEVGRFVGTSPTTGNRYDDPAVRRVARAEAEASIVGPGSAIDLWMWGRAPVDAITTHGRLDVIDQLRAAIEIDTQ